MNYLGEWFSWDSDMEWHVGLPWYRPTRLNHWLLGGDQGWQEVGAYPPYYIDNLPGILETGRGSPNWGVFYEHTQLPEKYRDGFLVCDYRWKSATRDEYATTGRLVAFFLKRDGASWKAKMEVLAKPKPGARDAAGKPINFALVDVEVAPDGSLYLSDHNQGVWRIYYNNSNAKPPTPSDAATALVDAALPTGAGPLVEEVLALPQPASESSRLREEKLRGALGAEFESRLQTVALGQSQQLPNRLRAIRLLASDFARLPGDFVKRMATDGSPEVRGQAAWLCGLRGVEKESDLIARLLNDRDGFVRRRAAEALGRWPVSSAVTGNLSSKGVTTPPLELLNDSSRQVRYAMMMALSRRPTERWLESALIKSEPQIRMRALVACLSRKEPLPTDTLWKTVRALLDDRRLSDEDRLDLLRVLALFRDQVTAQPTASERITQYLSTHFPDRDRNIRWEQSRLLGEYRVTQSFDKLLNELEREHDEITQLHLAQAVSRLSSGWTADQEERLLRWLLGTQRGWFAQFEGKGVEFPMFFSTVLADFGQHHRDALLRHLEQVDLGSLVGTTAVELIAEAPDADRQLIDLYRANRSADVKLKLLRALRKVPKHEVAAFLREEYARHTEPAFRGAILQSLAAQPLDSADASLLIDGLRQNDLDVIWPCANALLKLKVEPREPLANLLLSRIAERRRYLPAMEKLLTGLSGQRRKEFDPDPNPWRRIDDADYAAAQDFWKHWYEQRFAKKFEPAFAKPQEKTDEEIHRFILADASRGGEPVRGRRVYERIQCNTCHGVGVTPGQEGRLFGPDLAGVMQRLTRAELADALVYPSKQVADRFKTFVIEVKGGEPITGFITDQADDTVTIADREQVHRVARSQISSIAPQATSVMPERLLNQLSLDEVRDLLAFLEQNPSTPQTGK